MEKSRLWVFVIGMAALGCEAKASVRASGDTTSAKATTSKSGGPEHDSTTPTTVASAAPPSPTPSVTNDASALPPGCSLVCVEPNVGRLQAADETRLTTGLAETARALESCYPNKPTHTFQLRFGSASNLTGFGVDIDDEEGPACMIDVRSRMPPLTMAGPSTIRCTEKCKR
jgi:hypothetical protein